MATSALRFYEAEGLIHATRTSGGQRRFTRDELRRVAFIRIAQQIGLTLEEIRDAMASLPDNRVPTQDDWEQLSRSWQPRLEQQIQFLEDLKGRLTGCIGCGCLSLKHCHLLNPGDIAGDSGPGPRYVPGLTDS